MRSSLLLGMVLAMGMATCYASNNQTNEEFFGDSTTTIMAHKIFEDNDKTIKVRIKGAKTGDERTVDFPALTAPNGHKHYDEAIPPYSNAVYSVSVMLDMDNKEFGDFESKNSIKYHTLESETASEDKVAIGEWGNMYKVYTYVRPDMTTHEKKIIVGQYMIEAGEKISDGRKKFWDGRKFQKFAKRGFNSFMQERFGYCWYHTYKQTFTRFERESEFSTSKKVSEKIVVLTENPHEHGDDDFQSPSLPN